MCKPMVNVIFFGQFQMARKRLTSSFINFVVQPSGSIHKILNVKNSFEEKIIKKNFHETRLWTSSYVVY